MTQPSQPAFGSNMFGSSMPFGGSQSAFGTTSTTSTPAFGATTLPSGAIGTLPFGAIGSQAFGGTTTPVFGSTRSPVRIGGFKNPNELKQQCQQPGTLAFGIQLLGATVGKVDRVATYTGTLAPDSLGGLTPAGGSGFGVWHLYHRTGGAFGQTSTSFWPTQTPSGQTSMFNTPSTGLSTTTNSFAPSSSSPSVFGQMPTPFPSSSQAISAIPFSASPSTYNSGLHSFTPSTPQTGGTFGQTSTLFGQNISNTPFTSIGSGSSSAAIPTSNPICFSQPATRTWTKTQISTIGSSADPSAARMMVNGEDDAADLLSFLYEIEIDDRVIADF
ncbi:nuclear pore complex protein NUP98B-like [Rosa chinensis]|uniref:nuclear pore complex protein NUP98B-like n=1 Tax=Rosa chinensis TaxID=74649 RepID=UPI001AD8ED46|nr:nuclear pore complex protein NUP98B-like [Rosa chinensis]